MQFYAAYKNGEQYTRIVSNPACIGYCPGRDTGWIKGTYAECAHSGGMTLRAYWRQNQPNAAPYLVGEYQYASVWSAGCQTNNW